jgi:DNA-binding MarR family transcriptional regulator
MCNDCICNNVFAALQQGGVGPFLTGVERSHKQARVTRSASVVRRSKIDLDEFLPYLLNRVGSALVVRFTEDQLAGHGLSIAMWRVLAALSSNGPQRQIDLAELTSTDASTLSRLVTRLVRLGLVSRSRSRNNNREVDVALSPRGRTLVDRLIPAASRLEQDLSRGLSGRDVAGVKRALRRMHANLGQPPRHGRRT